MRLWSLHPKYLDSKGLVALWREALLAKHVLDGKTKGYLNHPQLDRFKKSPRPLDGIHQYLSSVHDEAVARQFNFDKRKFKKPKLPSSITVSQGQLKYEFKHLLAKLKIRDSKLYYELKNTKTIDPHPMFGIVKGDIEAWEKVDR